MGKFQNKLSRFLSGRYGTDNFCNFLFGAELIFLFFGMVFMMFGKSTEILWVLILSIVLYVLTLACMVWALTRYFSRNVAARRRENERFLRIRNRIFHPKKSKTSGTHIPADTPTHVFRACPKCGAVLRLPRKAGKHMVKCPRCEKRFKIKVR